MSEHVTALDIESNPMGGAITSQPPAPSTSRQRSRRGTVASASAPSIAPPQAESTTETDDADSEVTPAALPMSASGQIGTRGRRPAPVGESKRDKFRRLGEHRSRNVFASLRLVSNLAAPAYEWTEADVGKIFGNIRTAVDRAESEFAKKSRMPRLEDTFSLNG